MTGVETLDTDRHDGVEKAYEIDLIDKQRFLIYGCVEWGAYLQREYVVGLRSGVFPPYAEVHTVVRGYLLKFKDTTLSCLDTDITLRSHGIGYAYIRVTSLLKQINCHAY